MDVTCSFVDVTCSFVSVTCSFASVTCSFASVTCSFVDVTCSFVGVTCSFDPSLRSRRYLRAQGEKLEIPPPQKLSILSSAHRAHGSAHTNLFALENQSERELLIMLLAGLQCSKTCQFKNCFVFFRA